MPHHRNMNRAQCRVLMTAGGVVTGKVLTLRFSPIDVSEAMLVQAWDLLGRDVVGSPGMAGLHLLRHEAPQVAETTDQRICGGGRAPDCIVIFCAFASKGIDQFEARLKDQALVSALGLGAGMARERYLLSYSAISQDVVGATPV